MKQRRQLPGVSRCIGALSDEELLRLDRELAPRPWQPRVMGRIEIELRRRGITRTH